METLGGLGGWWWENEEGSQVSGKAGEWQCSGEWQGRGKLETDWQFAGEWPDREEWRKLQAGDGVAEE